MIVDDDMMSREVLALLAAEAEFDVVTFEDGESALESLTDPAATCPDIVLADMQMPGISGDSFARLLRSTCGPTTVLLAMSGTALPADRTSAFHGFLLKPFSMDDVRAAINHATPPPPTASPAADYEGALNRAIYDSFAKGMPADQLQKLYALSLDDADSRIELMRQAVEVNDDDAYRRSAHSIKGGCGMVGAVELANLASKMEDFGISAVDNIDPLKQFLAASARLRRILDALRK